MDPVRFISNPSTGKMGYAMAHEAVRRGARVILVSGPTHIKPPIGVNLVRVETALQMHTAVKKYFTKTDIMIAASAVSDYRPVKKSPLKIKKQSRKKINLSLIKNPDIIEEMAKKKGARIMIGFAAETGSLKKNALKKLSSKNLDFIVANDVSRPGAGFATDTNIVSVFDKSGSHYKFPKMTKAALCTKIFDIII
ncbi:MAG: phosphopantothenoylcysteine decarboxylase [bacterium]